MLLKDVNYSFEYKCLSNLRIAVIPLITLFNILV